MAAAAYYPAVPAAGSVVRRAFLACSPCVRLTSCRAVDLEMIHLVAARPVAIARQG